MKRFLTSVSLRYEPKASDVITFVKKTFFARLSYEIYIARCENADFRTRRVRKTAFYTRSDIKYSTIRYECDNTFSDECEFAARAEGE